MNNTETVIAIAFVLGFSIGSIFTMLMSEMFK